MGRKKTVIEIRVQGPRQPLALTFDTAAQALYIRVRKGKIAKTIEIEDGVMADVSARGLLIGIELLKPAPVDVLDRIAEEYDAPAIADLLTVGKVAEMFATA